MMTPTPSTRLPIFLAIAAVMAATRLNHFGVVPDASWAMFLVAGFYLRDAVRWAFPALMALAVLVDWIVIAGAGGSFWSHYCVSPGYWFLVPAYFSLWAAGTLVARLRDASPATTLAALVLAVVGGTAACHLFAQGGFYWFSDTVAAPTVAGWAKNYADWFGPYLRTTGIYVALAAGVHVAALGMLRTPARATTR